MLPTGEVGMHSLCSLKAILHSKRVRNSRRAAQEWRAAGANTRVTKQGVCPGILHHATGKAGCMGLGFFFPMSSCGSKFQTIRSLEKGGYSWDTFVHFLYFLPLIVSSFFFPYSH